MIRKFSLGSVLKVLKNKKGIILIETITAMLIFSVVAVCASAIFLATFKTYAKANEFAELSVLLNNLGKEICNDLNRSTVAPKKTGSTITITANSFTIEYKPDDAGILLKNNKYVFAPEYYKNKQLSIDLTQPDSNKPIYSLQLTISDSDGVFMQDRKFSVSPIMLQK